MKHIQQLSLIFIVSLFDTVITAAWTDHHQASLPFVYAVFSQYIATQI
jgi:hypothetical protein